MTTTTLSKALLSVGMAAGLVLAANPAQAAIFTIDDFNSATSYVVTDNTTNGAAVLAPAMPVTAGNTVMNVPGGALGWTRSISADQKTGPSGGIDLVETDVCSECQAGHFSSEAATTGNGAWIYNGPAIDLSNLEGTLRYQYAADLAFGGLRFTFDGTGSPDYVVTTGGLTATSGGGIDKLVAKTIPIDKDNPVFKKLTSVKIEVLGENVANLDFSIDNVGLPTVPVSGTISLLGLGLAGFGWKRFRGMAAA